MEWYGLDSSGSTEEPVEESCEPLGSIKCWEIIEWLSDWQLLKKDSAPWS
jgi:hypothetical protein